MSDKLILPDPVAAGLTEQELNLLHKLGGAWNDFLALPDIGRAAKLEVQTALHVVQNLVMARVAKRMYPTVFHPEQV